MAEQSVADVREDEEQGVKFQETVDLLVAAGYFRARIKGLPPFDKVVGGMTWCIETCNIDVDVYLLFEENLTIGQKISLTEKIVAVLPKMKCPHRLEPHQIQGLDFIHIFPVVQWLVKRAIETREETGDYVRSYSISQFNKLYNTPEDIAFENIKETAGSSVANLFETYTPKRRFRRQVSHKAEADEEMRVQSTLLEYGKKQGLIRMTSTEKGNSEHASKSRDSQSDDSASEAVLHEKISAAMSGMAALETSEKLPANVVGSIVGLQSSEIRQIASEYADKQAEIISLESGDAVGGGAQRHRRVIASLQRQAENQQKTVEESESQLGQLQKQHGELLGQFQEAKNLGVEMEKNLKSFAELENEDNQSILMKLHSLVAMNENLKQQEQEFRAHCKEELARLQSDTESLKSTHSDDDHEDKERSLLIERHYQADKEKLQNLRLLLARKNREIASLQRKLDEVPTRAELGQYQQRFLELYSQVSAKHKETKQFYTLYNTLDDTKLYLSKEVNLLNSILDTFSEAMSSQSNKLQFLKQFEGIVDGINQNKIKLEKKKQEEKMRRDQLNDTYLDLIEKQRVYFKTVKDFKEECRKNEILLAKLKGHRQ